MPKQSATSTKTPVQYSAKAINMENAAYNERRLTVLRMALSSFGGCIAGVLGLAWEKGLLFFLGMSFFMFFMLFFFKIGAKEWREHFANFSMIWKCGLIPGFLVKIKKKKKQASKAHSFTCLLFYFYLRLFCVCVCVIAFFFSPSFCSGQCF